MLYLYSTQLHLGFCGACTVLHDFAVVAADAQDDSVGIFLHRTLATVRVQGLWFMYRKG